MHYLKLQPPTVYNNTYCYLVEHSGEEARYCYRLVGYTPSALVKETPKVQTKLYSIMDGEEKEGK
jgi:hypothetical protein